MSYKPTGRRNGRPRVDWALRDPIILRALSSGCSFRDAAQWAGTSWDSLQRRRQVDADFAARLSQARTVFKVRCLLRIFEAAATDWRAAAWFLERAFPGEYGSADRAPLDAFCEATAPAERAFNQAASNHIATALAIAAGKDRGLDLSGAPC